MLSAPQGAKASNEHVYNGLEEYAPVLLGPEIYL